MKVLETIIPVFLMIFLGKFLKAKKFLSDKTIAGIKDLCVNVFLPVMAFDTLIHGNFSSNSILLILLELFALSSAFFIGFALKKHFDKDLQGYIPYALTTYEGGLFGWALVAILVGQKNMFAIITMDIFSGIFCFTVMATGLKLLAGEKLSNKEIFKSIITNPMIIAVILGFIGSGFNLGYKIDHSKFSTLYTKSTNFLIQPLNPLILLSIGTGLAFDWNILSKGLKLSLFRYLIQAVIYVIVMFAINYSIGLSPVLKVSLPMYFMCPTSFLLTMYAKEKKAIEFTSGYLSLEILITLIIFSIISIYAGQIL